MDVYPASTEISRLYIQIRVHAHPWNWSAFGRSIFKFFGFY